MLPAKVQQTDDLIRENRSQSSIDDGSGSARATSCGASTPPSRSAFRYSETMNSNLRGSSVYQRTARRLSATKGETYDTAENGLAGKTRSVG